MLREQTRPRQEDLAETMNIDSDKLFDVLSNSRRRAVVETVTARNDDEITVSELVDEVAEQENNTSIDEISSAERNRVYTSLYQTHLPRLDEVDVVEYDESEKRVTATENTSFVRLFLQAASDPGIFATSQEAKMNRYFAISTGFCAVLYLFNTFFDKIYPSVYIEPVVNIATLGILLAVTIFYLVNVLQETPLE